MINDRYRLIKKIGKGRSSVFLCRDSESPTKEIAIKILPAEAGKQEIKIFKDEYLTLQKLTHSGIIKSFDFGTVVKSEEIPAGSKFFTMEYYNGKSLKDYSFQNAEELKEIIKQLCSVLFYLHQTNYIYYDLKPENILYTSDNKIEIKLIDLGFARHKLLNLDKEKRGTAEYIAPELLSNKPHNHKVDLYSFGILLYKIIFKNFPFHTTNELEIYKAHIEKEFDYPDADVDPEIINGIKKLLSKNPDERYANSLEILKDLNINIEEDFSREWLPANIFSDRKDVINILKKYISDKESIEVFTVKGVEGAGKTLVAEEIFSSYSNAIIIKNNRSKSGIEFIRYLLKSVLFFEDIYPALSEEIILKTEDLFKTSPAKLNEELKIIFTRISSTANFILILDDFNSYDDFTIEILKEVIPILQVNKQKIILTENSNLNYSSDVLYNVQGINLSPFTDVQVEEFLELSFFEDFPKEELKKLILRYADLLPGSIKSFINDLLLLKIISFNYNEIKIKERSDTVRLLKSSHEEIYKLRFNTLNDDEKETAKLFSAFKITINKNAASELLNKSPENISLLIENLQKKNIFQPTHSFDEPLFISEGIKEYIYSKINNKKNYHLNIAEKISKSFKNFSRTELSRQYELAEKYSNVYLILQEEIQEAEKISAFSYQKKILEYAVKLPFSEEELSHLKFELCKTYNKLSEFKSSLGLAKELLSEPKFTGNINNSVNLIELQILKGRGLIGTGELEEGRDLLKSLISEVKTEEVKYKLLLDIAGAEFDLNNYSEAENICKEITSNSTNTEITARSFNILGIICAEKSNNLSEALKNLQYALEIYEKNKMLPETAGVESNISIIHKLKGDYRNVEKHLYKSLKINSSIGNLEWEGKLYINYGGYYFLQTSFDKAVEYYKKSLSIFISLGNLHEQGLVYKNLGEIYLFICEYEKSYSHLETAKIIFQKVKDINEELTSLFLLGKFYIKIEDLKETKLILKNFNLLLSNSVSGKEKYQNYRNYLNSLIIYLEGESDLSLSNKLNTIRNHFLNSNEHLEYFYSTILLAKVLIKSGLIKKAIEELKSELIDQLCQENEVFKAEREYIYGQIAKLSPGLLKSSAIEHFNFAYEIIKHYHIMELTWQLLFSMAQFYKERGNIGKMKESITYCKSVVEFITGNLESSHLKNSFLNKEEIRNILSFE